MLSDTTPNVRARRGFTGGVEKRRSEEGAEGGGRRRRRSVRKELRLVLPPRCARTLLDREKKAHKSEND